MAVFVFIVAVLAIAVVRTSDSQDRLHSLEEASNSASALERARGSFLNGVSNLISVAASGDVAALSTYNSELTSAKADLEEAREIASRQGRVEDAAELERIEGLIREFDTDARETAILFLQGELEIEEAQASLSGIRSEIATSLDAAAERERAAFLEERESLGEALSSTLVSEIAVGILAVFGGAFTMAIILFAVIRPLGALRKSVQSIAEGDLTRRAPVSGPYEVRSLAADVNLMAETLISRNEEVESAHRELQTLNDTLETRVHERTAALERLTEELKAEIEDREQTQEALIESEERFSSIFRSSPVAISLTSLETGKFIDVNDCCLELMGLSRAEVIGRTSEELGFWINDEDRAKVGRALEGDGTLREVDLQFRRANGEVLDAICSFSLITVRGSQAAVSIMTDVTESRRARRELHESNETLTALFESSPVAIIGVDADTCVTMWNKTAESIFGWKRDEVTGKSYARLIPEEQRSEFESLRLRAFSGESFTGVETVRLKKSGDRVAVSVSTASVRTRDGQVKGVVAFVVDITERKRAENALRESEERYRTLFQRNLAGVYRTTLEGDVVECNEALAQMLGYESPQEIITRPVVSYYPNSEQREAFLQALVRDGRVTAHETELRHRDGSKVWVLESASLVPAEDEKTFIEGTMIDITEHRRAQDTIRHLAYYDTLTELPNRTLFVDRLEQAIARSQRTGEMVGVLFVDMDHFKDINDSVGHAEGDMMLRKVAGRLKGLLRDGDTIARFGGDEFVMLLPEVESVDDARQVAERMVRSMNKPWKVNGREVHMTGSIGIAIAPLDGEDPETLLRNADTAMYRAKEHGRDGVELYTSEMNARIVARLSVENALRRGIANEEFVLYYQPQVDMLTGEIVGVEALIRWQHPERGLVFPGDFISVAESSGLIVPIGDWVLRQACEDARRWEMEGLPRFRVAVNLSARQFESHDLVEKIGTVLRETGLERDRLQVEITEGVAMADVEFTVSTLRELREMGVQVAIDDFGTGHSSLSYIKNLPIDTVKIDGSFIHDVSTDPVDAALVTAIVAISHSMGLNVIAEGVETEEQLEFLRNPANYPGLVQDRPCDQFQGFLFSRAIPAEELRALLTQNGRKNGVRGGTKTTRSKS